MNWMIMPLNRYAEFDGRSCRAEYWMFTLFLFLVIGAATAIFFVGGGLDDNGEISSFGGFWLLFFSIAYLLIFFVPSISVCVRRWHDLNQSGWMFLIFMVLGAIPVLGALAGLANFIWFCLPGTPGTNNYGEAEI